MTVSKSRNSNQTLKGSRGTSRGLVDTSFAFVTDLILFDVQCFSFTRLFLFLFEIRVSHVSISVRLSIVRVWLLVVNRL